MRLGTTKYPSRTQNLSGGRRRRPRQMDCKGAAPRAARQVGEVAGRRVLGRGQRARGGARGGGARKRWRWHNGRPRRGRRAADAPRSCSRGTATATTATATTATGTAATGTTASSTTATGTTATGPTTSSTTTCGDTELAARRRRHASMWRRGRRVRVREGCSSAARTGGVGRRGLGLGAGPTIPLEPRRAEAV